MVWNGKTTWHMVLKRLGTCCYGWLDRKGKVGLRALLDEAQNGVRLSFVRLTEQLIRRRAGGLARTWQRQLWTSRDQSRCGIISYIFAQKKITDLVLPLLLIEKKASDKKLMARKNNKNMKMTGIYPTDERHKNLEETVLMT